MKFQPPKGTRDLLPEEMEKMQFVIDIIREIFEKYGFVPLETPAFEDFEVLSGKAGKSIKDEIYYFKDKAGRELGLRFDLTVPLARVLANNPNLPKPFKRYQIGKAWRYDNPQAMRYREFWQADIDIIGSSSILADVECVAAIVDCFKKLGFKDFFVRINNRKLLEFLFNSIGISKEKIFDLFRTIDKMDKIGLDDVKKELEEKGFDSEKIIETIKTPYKKIPENEGLKELKDFLKISKLFGIEKYLKIDLSLVRGLDYYTGPVFEVMIGKEKVTFAAGGRYDNLIKNLGGPDLPATGISIGLDRVVKFIEKIEKKKTKLFVIPVKDELREKALEICQDLRKKGFACDTDLMNRKLSKQLEFANSLKVQYVIFVGEKELKKNSVKLRDMRTGKEKIIKIIGIQKTLY